MPLATRERYELQLEHHLGSSITALFPEFTVEHQPDGSTILSGELPDQAALHGVLERVRDLGLTLHAVNHKRTRSSCSSSR